MEKNKQSSSSTADVTSTSQQTKEQVEKWRTIGEMDQIIIAELGESAEVNKQVAYNMMKKYAELKMQPLKQEIEYLKETQQRILNILGVNDEYGN